MKFWHVRATPLCSPEPRCKLKKKMRNAGGLVSQGLAVAQNQPLEFRVLVRTCSYTQKLEENRGTRR